jgi:hypothetical protein
MLVVFFFFPPNIYTPKPSLPTYPCLSIRPHQPAYMGTPKPRCVWMYVCMYVNVTIQIRAPYQNCLTFPRQYGKLYDPPGM